MYNLGYFFFPLPSETFCHFNFCNCLFMWKGFCLTCCISQSDCFRGKKPPKSCTSLWPGAPQAFCMRGSTQKTSSSSFLHSCPEMDPTPFLGTSGQSSCSVAQSCPTLCNPIDCSPPGSSVHGIVLARILEWVAISSSRGSSWPRDWTHVSCNGRWILYHWATWEASNI